MGVYGTITNEPFEVDVLVDARDNGWSISGGLAIHESCNEGFIKNRNLVTEAGKDYKVTYTVSGRTSGEVYVIVGGEDGISRIANGTYTETITATDTSGVQFWSDGDLAVSVLIIADGEIEGATLVFNEKYDTFVGWRSYVPNYATKFLDDVLVFQNGTMWRQNSNPVRNNFFGDQYPSIIKFYVNVEPSKIKNFYTIRLKSNKVWAVTEIMIPPRVGKSNGQRSRLKTGRFKVYQGDFFADFMRDMNDPRFLNELDALTQGALLQGNWMEITLENTDTGEVRLASVDVQVDVQNYSY